VFWSCYREFVPVIRPMVAGRGVCRHKCSAVTGGAGDVVSLLGGDVLWWLSSSARRWCKPGRRNRIRVWAG